MREFLELSDTRAQLAAVLKEGSDPAEPVLMSLSDNRNIASSLDAIFQEWQEGEHGTNPMREFLELPDTRAQLAVLKEGIDPTEPVLMFMSDNRNIASPTDQQAARLDKTAVGENRRKVVLFGERDERTNAIGDHQPLKNLDALDSGVGHR